VGGRGSWTAGGRKERWPKQCIYWINV
jgi:hypothetical protein